MNLILTLLVAFSVSSAKPSGKSSQMVAQSMIGDREVRFLVTQESERFTIERWIGGEHKQSRPLKKNDWRFLVSQFRKLPQPKNIPPECSRARIDVTLTENGKTIARSSCLGIKTVTSAHYSRFSQTLALAFE